jgi:hypothetical protein
MVDEPPISLALAERVAEAAGTLGIELALIGAVALAVHHHVRATLDVDLATAVDPYVQLRALEQALRAQGLHTELRTPDDQDPLGGVLEVWEHVDDDGEPLSPVEVVNFSNPHRPRANPGHQAIRGALPLEPGSVLRCVRLPDLIALKLYSGGLQDLADVVELLARNPGADIAEIRATCQPYGLDLIDELIAQGRGRS